MYRRIMVAIDGSDLPSPVLEAAMEMAERFEAKLALCHALDDTILAQQFARVALPDGVSPIEASLRDGARAFLEQAAKIAQERGIDTDIVLVDSESEHVPALLARAAADWQAELLVVGGHGSQGVGRLLGGSVAEQLARKGSVSLLLVRS